MNDVSRGRIEHGTLSGSYAIGAVAALIAVMFMGSTIVTPLYVLYQQKFGFSQITLTLVYAVYVVGNLAALLVLGRLSDRMGRRRIILSTMGLAAISTVLFLFATSTPWLYWARMLSGCAISLATGSATAWLVELSGARDKTYATLAAACANMIGLAAGALLAGYLAQYAPWPLHLTFVVYLIALAIVGAFIYRTRETVQHANASLRNVSLRPQLGVPREIRLQFITPAVTAFGTFALGGFYAALIPSVMIHSLHETNHAAGGAVVFELCIIGAIAVIATRNLKSRTAMLGGLVLLLPCLALLVAAQELQSMLVLLTGTALSGVAMALGYRGSLQVVNEIAPADRRAEVVSSYLIVCYSGNALPVVGVGVLSNFSTPEIASAAFAGTIAVFALVALGVAFKRRELSSERRAFNS